MLDIVGEHSAIIKTDIDALDVQNKCMDRQNSLRPIFVNYFKVTLYHRVKAVTFRRILADHGFDMEQLEELWNEKKKEAFIEIVNVIDELKADEKAELIDLLDCHFDPEKQPIQPIVKRHRSKRGKHLKK